MAHCTSVRPLKEQHFAALLEPFLFAPSLSKTFSVIAAVVALSAVAFSAPAAFASPRTTLSTNSSSNLVVHDEYLVVRKSRPSAAPALSSLSLTSPLAEASPDGSGRIEVVRASSTTSVSDSAAGAQALQQYRRVDDQCSRLKLQDPSIELCSPNFVRTRFESSEEKVPTDDLFNYQWPLQSNSSFGSLHATRAWAYGTGASSPVVAVIDGGADYSHPDLVKSIWNNPGEIPGNGLDDDGNGYVDDHHGVDVTNGLGDPFSTDDHGTHVMGIIGAQGDNGFGTAGVNWNAAIIAVKASGSEGYFTTKALVRAMDYLVDLKLNRGISIVAVNASLGGYNFSEVEFEGIRRLRDAGILFVAAAGNEAVNIDNSPVFPANYRLENIISVLATDRHGDRADFSNYGFIGADIAAPGVDILSTISGNTFALMDGTSMAAPFVTGAISLLASSAPQLSWKELRGRIFNTGRPIANLERFTSTGRILDLERLMADVSGVATLIDGASSNPIRRNASFRLTLASRKGRATKSIALGSRFLIKALSANSLQAVGTSTSYIDFSINGQSCHRPVKVYGVTAASYMLSAAAPSSPSLSEIKVSAFNGEGTATSRRRVALRGTSTSAQTVTRRTIDQACAKLIASLEFVY